MEESKTEAEISISRLDIRVGVIRKVTQGNGLYTIEIDVGKPRTRTVVSGLGNYILVEEMEGRKVCVVCNMKGIVSQAFVLSASSNRDHTQVELLDPPESSAVGDRVTFPGQEGVPDDVLDSKVWEALQADLYTSSELVACYKDIPFTTAAGVCTVSSVCGSISISIGWIGRYAIARERYIGSGSFGTVFICFDPVCKVHVATKVVAIYDQSQGIPSSLIREVSALKDMDHPNVVKLLDVVVQKFDYYSKVSIVMSPMDMDLYDFFKPERTIDPTLVKSLFRQLLLGLDHCHSRQIIHRDLKPENVLVDETGQRLKIADFGATLPLLWVPMCADGGDGTIAYNAPEILVRNVECTTASDVWSAGCVFAFMLNKRVLFDISGVDADKLLKKIFDIIGVSTKDCWFHGRKPNFGKCLGREQSNKKIMERFKNLIEPSGLDLLLKMLCVNPQKRITIADALEHPYFGSGLEKDAGGRY